MMADTDTLSPTTLSPHDSFARQTPAQRQARIAKANATRAQREQALRDSAPPVGKALTIAEVLARKAMVPGNAVTASRVMVLSCLRDCFGGRYEDASGAAVTSLIKHLTAVHEYMPKAGPDGRHNPSLITAMRRDEMIGCDFRNSRRCLAVYLLDPLVGGDGDDPQAPTHRVENERLVPDPPSTPSTDISPAKPHPTRANGHKSRSRSRSSSSVLDHLPLPALGSTIRVVGQFLEADDDGNEHIRLVLKDNALGTYGTLLEGFQAPAPKDDSG